ncbi:recombinase family protein [Nemorincola caseinilytica]|uniref:Recombinase family protein n=1 Tax=Nemorincola caseinilytica TaxID=2054315 RepID=A0ABP8N5U1_9BACT
METIKTAAIYARVSTIKQEDEQTIQNQTLSLKGFATEKGISIIAEYLDDGWSGDMLARPALDQLRQDAKKKPWQAVLIYDPDRLARRYSYQELVLDELRETGIEVLFVTVSAPKNSEEKILHGVRGLFAEYERAKISERFRIGKLRKVRDGNILVTVPKYGYNYIPKENGKHGYYVINEYEADIVRGIFQWVAEEKFTLRKVAKRLKDLNIPPRKSTRGVWSTSTLSTLLKHTAYVGEAHYGKSYAVVPENPLKVEKYRRMKKTSRKIRPKNEWLTISVPAIVERELFDKAQDTIKANFALARRNRKNKYLLINKIWCICGKRRCGEGVKNGKYKYYRCEDRVACYPLPPMCSEAGISVEVADTIVWGQIVKLMTSPVLISQHVKRWITKTKHADTHASNDLQLYEKELAKLKSQEARIYAAYAEGLFPIESLKQHVQSIKTKTDTIHLQLTALHEQVSEVEKSLPANAIEIENFAEAARQTLLNIDFEAKRDIVLNVIEKVIGTRNELKLKGFIPISQNVELFTSNGSGQSATRQDFVRSSGGFPFELTIALPPAGRTGPSAPEKKNGLTKNRDP